MERSHRSLIFQVLLKVPKMARVVVDKLLLVRINGMLSRDLRTG